MREAPALAGVAGDRIRPAPARRPKRPTPKRRWHSSLLGRAFARPGVTVAGATFAALMTGIVANAVLLQKGHRPTPLFGAAHQTPIAPPKAELAPAAPEPAVAAPRSQPAATVESQPPTPVRPVPPAPPASPPARAVVPQSAPTAKAPPAKPVVAKVTQRVHTDSIARLLGALGGPAQSKTAAATGGLHAPPKTKPSPVKPRPELAGKAVTPHN